MSPLRSATTRGPDPLVSGASAERLHYSTGELLGADDFRDEQTYHRRQLARALLHLHGSGTIAGLVVQHRHKPGTGTKPDEVEIRVKPGLALDHAGRLIEVPRDACLQLRKWFTFLGGRETTDTEVGVGHLRRAWRPDGAVAAGGAVIADLFLSFHECPRGYTPAFASGPFDALDASQPSRVRDAYELSLVLRPEATASLPRAADPWSTVDGATVDERIAAAVRLSAAMWHNGLQSAPENPAGVDRTAVLLARLRIPARPNADESQPPDPDWTAAAWAVVNDVPANLDNGVRHVLLPPGAIRHLIR